MHWCSRTTRRVTRVGRTAEQIAAEIKQYCVDCPAACDSIEGIAWRLARRAYVESREEIEHAITLLVSQGVLDRHELPDGSVIFGCHQE